MRDPITRGLLALPILAVLVLTAAACGGSDSSTTSPTSTVSSSTETFTGSIGQNGTAVHPFTIKSSGYTLMVGFTSITPSTVTALGVGIGAWDSTTSTCGLNQTQNDSAKAGSTAISGTAGSGGFCVRVYDGGNIAEGATASYTLQIEHY